MSLSRRRIVVTGGSGFIGTNVIQRFAAEDVDVLNIDLKAPPVTSERASFVCLDIQNREALQKAVSEFAPQIVVHLAGRTDTFGKTLSDYEANTVGSRNVVAVAAACRSVERFILTSSQFVCGPGPLPQDDLDFRPHTVYGESKVITEQELRASRPPFCWTIVRPTNIWGPWHPRYPLEFWRILRQGLYVHPAGAPVIRSYGFVGNVAEQIVDILSAPHDTVSGRVFYLGDEPIELFDWANGFSLALTGKPVRKVPIGVFRAMAYAGEGLKLVTGRSPLTRSRLRSMIENYPTPMGATFATLGPPRTTLAEGIAQTVSWLSSLPDFAYLQTREGPPMPQTRRDR